MICTLLAVSLLSPAFGPVHECGDLRPLRWESTLFRDPDALFRQEAFLPETEWQADPDDTTGDRLIHDCFGAGAPHSRDVVVHHYPPAAFTPQRTRPVVLVSGAGDNALRSLSFLAVSLSHEGFHSYALTFAHPHGDNFQQAEHVANLLAYVAQQHPGVKIDVIAYSKGGMAARIYASNGPDSDWRGTHDAYDARGTRYRGDIGRLLLVGVPNGGVDTVFRWPSANLFAVSARPLDTPTSWIRYYPQTTASPLVSIDLTERSIYRAGDHYPGQAQMLADLRAAHPLPGGDARFGAYAVQPDYFTTYEGGLGFTSQSLGLRVARDQAGGVIARLQSLGIDPDIELTVVGGGNPILGVGALGPEWFTAGWGDLDAAGRRNAWEALVAGFLGEQVAWIDAWRHDLPRLFAGTAILGEISGPSDGLLFTDSALSTDGLTGRGAHLAHRKLFQALTHAELIAAGTLAETFYGDPELAGGLHDPSLAAKYGDPENQAVDWYLSLLAEAVPEAPPETDAGPAPDGSPPDAELPPPAPLADAATTPDATTADAATPDATALADDGTPIVPTPDAATTSARRDLTGDFFSGSCQTTPGGAPALLLLSWALRGLRRKRAGLR